MDEKNFAYLEYLALARLISIHEANIHIWSDNYSALIDVLQFARELHQGISELFSPHLLEGIVIADDIHAEIGNAIYQVEQTLSLAYQGGLLLVREA